MAHTCKALVIRCMDFRLGPELNRFLDEQGLSGGCDIVSLAGAARGFLSDDSRDLLMKQVQISKELHGITEVYLMNHTDCGAYGGKKSFASEAEERERMIGDMRKAAETIEDKFPDLEVKLWMPHIEEDGHETKVWVEGIS